MKMRNATEDDLETIISLIQDNKIKKSDINATSGLVEYDVNHSIIKKAIKSKEAYLVVLEGETEKDIIGFMLGYQKSFLTKNRLELKNDQIIQYLLENIKYDFVYADILVVDKKYQNHNYGRMLLLSFLDDTKNNTIITAIAQSPIQNEASLSLIKGFRFQKESEITVYNDLTFTLFELDN